MKDRVGAADCSSYVSTINGRLEALSSSPPKHTIFKIHELLRRENAMAYEPEILAIGPYHRGKERLQDMEVWKLRGLKSILDLQKEKDATKYVEAMKRLEGRARECYSESTICINADEFAEMLLLDGCFIIQFLLSVLGCHKYVTMINHRFFDVDWVQGSLCRDMLLLENQIPLFVLDELFYLTKLSRDGTDFHDIAQKFAGIAFENFTGIAFENFTGIAFKNFTGIPIPPKTTESTHSHDIAEDLDCVVGSSLCFSSIPIPPKTTESTHSHDIAEDLDCVVGSSLCFSSFPIPPKTTESTHSHDIAEDLDCVVGSSLCFSSIPIPPKTTESTHSHDIAEDLDLVVGSSLCFSSIPIPPKTTELSTDSTHSHDNIAQVLDFDVGSGLCFRSISISPQTTSLSNVNDVEHLLGLLHHAFCLPVINPEAQDSRPSNSVDDNGTGLLLTRSSIKLLAEKLRSLSCGMLLDDDKAAVNYVWNSDIIPSATKLHDAGVTLKIKNVDKENPFKVTFDNGVLEVPIFNVFDSTETVYRNLIAYEQYFQQNSNFCFSHHASFMDCLIDSPEDVALLSRCGIIGNFIGDDEAISTMFNKLCKHITFSMKNSNYAQIFEKVNAHCRKRRHRWMAKLKRDYFNNPWSFISFFAAFLLLLLTFTQTVFSALAS